MLLYNMGLFAQSSDMPLEQVQLLIDSIERSMQYEKGTVTLADGMATLNIPEGFKFLNAKQAEYVITELWGNPKSDNITMGMILPQEAGVMSADAWTFNIQYDAIGYVDDSDAADINYDDLLKQLQEEEVEENKQREQNGYSAIHTVGWASPPYYDADKKVLHWAKELQFGAPQTGTPNTLNYNVRILGRKGVLVLNAIATVDKLEEVKKAIPSVLNMVAFEQGHRYSDFNPDVDEVAAWTIGGLVAGKVLAKAGFFAVLAKFWKVIAIALAGAGSFLWKKFRKSDA
jgi:uncharacterized membrane-anchored protein